MTEKNIPSVVAPQEALLQPGVVDWLKSIDDFAEQVRGHLCIVGGRVSGLLVPFEARRCDSACQHRLAEGHAAQCCCIETTKRMKRITLDFGSCDGLVQKAEIESRIVANKNRSAATSVFDGRSHAVKQAL